MSKTTPKNILLSLLGIVLFLLLAITNFIGGIMPVKYDSINVTVLVTLFSVGHGVIAYGLKRILISFCIVFVISWSYESFSIIYGFPFGHYNYSALLGFKLVDVPLSIMPAYFSYGYLSWTMARILIRIDAEDRYDFKPLVMSVMASFIMTFWDLSFEPLTSTINKSWTWQSGGSYFGAPVSNFAGWLLCTFTFFIVISYLYKIAPTTIPYKNKYFSYSLFWYLPVLVYATIFFRLVSGLIFYGGLDYKMAIIEYPKIRWVDDIYGSLFVISLFTIVPVTLLCLYQIRRSHNI